MKSVSLLIGPIRAVIAQVVEHDIGNIEVNSANLFNGSKGVNDE